MTGSAGPPEPAAPARPAARPPGARHTAALEPYRELLATEGIRRGLIGPREAERLWERHLDNCAAIADLVPECSAVLDVGSGAGLPGLVLALIRQDLQVTLLDAALRRATFLAEAVERFGLGSRVQVVQQRVEDLGSERRWPVVTARALARLPQLVEWCWPRVAPGGRLVALVGERTGPDDLVGLPAGAAWSLEERGASDGAPPLARVVLGQR